MINIYTYIFEKLKIDKDVINIPEINFENFGTCFESIKDVLCCYKPPLKNGPDYTYLWEDSKKTLTLEFNSNFKKNDIINIYFFIKHRFKISQNKNQNNYSIKYSENKIIFFLNFKNE